MNIIINISKAILQKQVSGLYEISFGIFDGFLLFFDELFGFCVCRKFLALLKILLRDFI